MLFFQVALDAIEELCYEMSLHREEAMEEYAIFVVTHRGESLMREISGLVQWFSTGAP